MKRKIFKITFWNVIVFLGGWLLLNAIYQMMGDGIPTKYFLIIGAILLGIALYFHKFRIKL